MTNWVELYDPAKLRPDDFTDFAGGPLKALKVSLNGGMSAEELMEISYGVFQRMDELGLDAEPTEPTIAKLRAEEEWQPLVAVWYQRYGEGR